VNGLDGGTPHGIEPQGRLEDLADGRHGHGANHDNVDGHRRALRHLTLA
jgi:hypothetical protein